MAQRLRVVFAACAICLLLTAAPIDAGRLAAHGMENVEAQELKGVEALKSQWWFGTCSRLQDRFAQVSSRAASQVQTLNQTGEVGYTSASRSMFSVWQMARLVRRAQRHECAWAEDVDLEPLRQIIHATLSSNPCLPVVESRLQSSSEESAEEQTDVLLSSMGMLMTADCEAQSMTDRPAQAVYEPHDDDTVDEEVEELLVDAMGAESADASLLQVKEGQPITSIVNGIQIPSPLSAPSAVAEATFRLWPPPSWTGVDSWIIRRHPITWGGEVILEGASTSVQSAGPSTAAQWISHGIGVGVWLIMFSLLCAGAVYLFAFIISALLCLLRSILLVLLGRTTSLKTCLDRAVERVSDATNRESAQLAVGLCVAGGAVLMTTSGGVVGATIFHR